MEMGNDLCILILEMSVCFMMQSKYEVENLNFLSIMFLQSNIIYNEIVLMSN